MIYSAFLFFFFHFYTSIHESFNECFNISKCYKAQYASFTLFKSILDVLNTVYKCIIILTHAKNRLVNDFPICNAWKYISFHIYLKNGADWPLNIDNLKLQLCRSRWPQIPHIILRFASINSNQSIATQILLQTPSLTYWHKIPIIC